MMRWLRRFFWLGLLGAGGYGGYQVVIRRQAPPPATRTGDTVNDLRPFVDASAKVPRWVTPIDGQCPEGYPVKANANSGIYHVPGGRFYARTVPERCYASADDATADGYRPAKA
jgi:hypothetical protein